MKAFLITCGSVFALLVVAHIVRVRAEPQLALTRHVGPTPFEQLHKHVAGQRVPGRRVALWQRRGRRVGSSTTAPTAGHGKDDYRSREEPAACQGIDSSNTTPCALTCTNRFVWSVSKSTGNAPRSPNPGAGL